MRVLVLLSSLLVVAMAMRDTQLSQFDTTYVTITEDDTYYYMSSDGMPHHAYDDSVNPNDAEEQDYSFTIPITPVENADGPVCVQGEVGVTLWGKYIH